MLTTLPRFCRILALSGALVTAANPVQERWQTIAPAGLPALTYAVVLPDDFDPARDYPTLLALPPGGQGKGMVERGLELYFEREARARGWIVISPAAPDDSTFHTGAEASIGALLDAVLADHPVEGGRFHVAGVSNGGRSAFRIATQAPERFLSLTVAPGYASEEDVGRLGAVAGMPISLFVGARDAHWMNEARGTVARLRALGASDVVYETRDGEDHVLSEALAPRLFERLESIRTAQRERDAQRPAIAATLDALHQAAAVADYEGYFSLFAPDAVFIGTDANERWTLAEFREYARPRFEGASAWTYEVLERHIEVGERVAWFDERLHNARYGETRGSGVLVLSGERWRIAHYVLSFAIPNEAAAQVVEVVQSSPPQATASAPADPLFRQELASDADMAFVVPGAERRGDPVRSIPIRSLVSDDYSDLEFLRSTLDGVRIVQLGESGHGMGETALLKSRLVRFLHQELDFDVFALESDLYQCANADGTAGGADPTTTLFKCAFGDWHVEEVLPLFQHLRASHDTDRPLHLAGFDVQPIGTNKKHRPEFLAELVRDDAEYAARVRELDALFLEIYAQDGRERRASLRDRRDALLAGYGELTTALDERLATSSAPDFHRRLLVGRQTVRSIIAYVRMQTATDGVERAEARNLGMAENVRFLAEELYPGRKLVVWAHNTHIRHASEAIPVNSDGGPGTAARDMGTWLREWYGRELYTVGIHAFQGEAVNNSREPYAVEPASPEHLEHRLARAGLRLAFTELRGQAEWATTPQTVRYNGQTDQELVPADQYDALVLIAEVSSPTFLY